MKSGNDAVWEFWNSPSDSPLVEVSPLVEAKLWSFLIFQKKGKLSFLTVRFQAKLYTRSPGRVEQKRRAMPHRDTRVWVGPIFISPCNNLSCKDAKHSVPYLRYAYVVPRKLTWVAATADAHDPLQEGTWLLLLYFLVRSLSVRWCRF